MNLVNTLITFIIIAIFIMLYVVLCYYITLVSCSICLYLLSFHASHFLNFCCCTYQSFILLRYYYQEMLTLYLASKINPFFSIRVNLCSDPQVSLKHQSHVIHFFVYSFILYFFKYFFIYIFCK